MKTYGHIAFLMVWACLTACTHGVVETRHGTSLRTATLSPALSSVDSLMWVQPDSALACLLPYFDTCCRDAKFCVSTSTEYDRHYAHLMLSELLYKNDYAQTNRAELLDAVAYFDSLCDAARHVSTNIAFLDARAHYINGVGFYEHDSVVPACQEYMKALEVMEGCFEEKELAGGKAKFMALTYTHLSNVYSDQYLHEQAIYFGKSALAYYQKYDAEPWHIAWVLNTLGAHYEIMNDYDSASFFCNQGLNYLSDTNSLTYRDLSTHLAFLTYKEGTAPVSSFKKLQNFLARAESEREYTSRCLIVGEVYYHERRFDSAWIYLNTVYNHSQSISSKKQAAEWLVEICKTQGKDEEMIKYAEFLVPFANQEENKSEIKSQLTELYNEFSQNKLEQRHQKETIKHLKFYIMTFSGMSLIILIIIGLYYNNKRKKQYLENQIDEVKYIHDMKQKALSSRLKKSNEALRELKGQIKQQNNNSYPLTETQAATFTDEPICQLIMERVEKGQFKSQMNCIIYKSYALDKEQIVALRNAVNRHFNHFTERLAQTYPSLTKSDLDYCCLYLLGLSDADIAALMQRAYNTINERNSKLKRIFGCDSLLSVTLQVMANEVATV